MSTYSREDLRQNWLAARRAAGFSAANAVLKAWGDGSIEGVKERDIVSCITTLKKLADDRQETVVEKNGAGFPTGTRKAPVTTGKARTLQDVADKAYSGNSAAAAPSFADHGFRDISDPALHRAAWDRFNNPPLPNRDDD